MSKIKVERVRDESKPAFEPFELRITVDTPEVACFLWHLFNESLKSIRERAKVYPYVPISKGLDGGDLWDEIDDELRKQGLRGND